jgi:hypothetical protein
VIYCVVPPELAPELLEKMTEYYAGDPNVTVILDRRRASRRRHGSAGEGDEHPEPRITRDRRRSRVAGEFPPIPAGPQE